MMTQTDIQINQKIMDDANFQIGQLQNQIKAIAKETYFKLALRDPSLAPNYNLPRELRPAVGFKYLPKAYSWYQFSLN